MYNFFAPFLVLCKIFWTMQQCHPLQFCFKGQIKKRRLKEKNLFVFGKTITKTVTCHVIKSVALVLIVRKQKMWSYLVVYNIRCIIPIFESNLYFVTPSFLSIKDQTTFVVSYTEWPLMRVTQCWLYKGNQTVHQTQSK